MKENILPCIHHIHHNSDGTHTVHHCGGNHGGAGYTIRHCKCGLHAIDAKYISLYPHSITEVPTFVEFTSKCNEVGKGWYHIESAVRR